MSSTVAAPWCRETLSVSFPLPTSLSTSTPAPKGATSAFLVKRNGNMAMSNFLRYFMVKSRRINPVGDAANGSVPYQDLCALRKETGEEAGGVATAHKRMHKLFKVPHISLCIKGEQEYHLLNGPSKLPPRLQGKVPSTSFTKTEDSQHLAIG